ncbi:MAG: hypothetical protein RLZZ253_1009 [Verrucomicrobiota bacterium]|jgi:hypothetical protein
MTNTNQKQHTLWGIADQRRGAKDVKDLRESALMR